MATLVGPIYNIAFTEEVPFDCQNVTGFSHKHCCALFFYLKPSERFGRGLALAFLLKVQKFGRGFALAFQLNKGSPPPVIWAHAYGIDSGSMNCGIIKVPVNWKVGFSDYSHGGFLFRSKTNKIACPRQFWWWFSVLNPRQTILVSQEYSDGDFQFSTFPFCLLVSWKSPLWDCSFWKLTGCMKLNSWKIFLSFFTPLRTRLETEHITSVAIH